MFSSSISQYTYSDRSQIFQPTVSYAIPLWDMYGPYTLPDRRNTWSISPPSADQRIRRRCPSQSVYWSFSKETQGRITFSFKCLCEFERGRPPQKDYSMDGDSRSFQTPTGRSFFLTPRPVDVLKGSDDLEYPLAKLVAFTEHKDTIRRGGVASSLK